MFIVGVDVQVRLLWPVAGAADVRLAPPLCLSWYVVMNIVNRGMWLSELCRRNREGDIAV